MTPLFINSATIAAPERFVLAGGRWRCITLGVRYGLVEHPTEGPVLIDTGYGPRAVSDRNRTLALRAYGALLRPRLDPDGQPPAALRARGVAAADVRRIIVTHFHPDHVAGLRDFPAPASPPARRRCAH